MRGAVPTAGIKTGCPANSSPRMWGGQNSDRLAVCVAKSPLASLAGVACLFAHRGRSAPPRARPFRYRTRSRFVAVVSPPSRCRSVSCCVSFWRPYCCRSVSLCLRAFLLWFLMFWGWSTSAILLLHSCYIQLMLFVPADQNCRSRGSSSGCLVRLSFELGM